MNEKLKKILGVWYGPALCLAAGAAPIAISLAAGLFGLLLGCDINESGAEACVRAGVPFGALLYPLGLAGWFSLLTLPVCAAAAAAWSAWIAWRRFSGRSNPGA